MTHPRTSVNASRDVAAYPMLFASRNVGAGPIKSEFHVRKGARVEAVCNQTWIALKTFFLEMGWKRTLLCLRPFIAPSCFKEKMAPLFREQFQTMSVLCQTLCQSIFREEPRLSATRAPWPIAAGFLRWKATAHTSLIGSGS